MLHTLLIKPVVYVSNKTIMPTLRNQYTNLTLAEKTYKMSINIIWVATKTIPQRNMDIRLLCT